MTKYRKILITGAGGQLGHKLQTCAPGNLEVAAYNRRQLDVSDPVMLQGVVDSVRPEVILNAAAYTAVDRAEEEPENAYAVNRDGPRYLGSIAKEFGIFLFHISTDFVFDGEKGSPYSPYYPARPKGIYGQSKLAGEAAIHSQIPGQYLIVRTSWLYSAAGKNFLTTMLRLMQEKDELAVVADQVGTPTYAGGLARVVWGMLAKGMSGLHHWSDAGVASWYDFAVAIQEEALAVGLLEQEKPIRPIPTREFPTPAIRPAYSVLDKTRTWEELGYTAPHWRQSLRQMLREMQGSFSL